MKVSGFTFIKNGLTLGYPVLESILSIEPLCDEVIVNVGFEDEQCTQDILSGNSAIGALAFRDPARRCHEQ